MEKLRLRVRGPRLGIVDMNVIAAIVLCALAADPAVQADAPVNISLWAIQASNTPTDGTPQKTAPKNSSTPEKHYDQASKSLEKTLKGLPYAWFKTLSSTRKAVKLGEEKRIEVAKGKTLRMRPLEKTEDGRIRLEVILEVKHKDPKKAPIKALETRLLMRPGKAVKLRGLKMDQGELILVLVAGG